MLNFFENNLQTSLATLRTACLASSLTRPTPYKRTCLWLHSCEHDSSWKIWNIFVGNREKARQIAIHCTLSSTYCQYASIGNSSYLSCWRCLCFDSSWIDFFTMNRYANSSCQNTDTATAAISAHNPAPATLQAGCDKNYSWGWKS